MSPISPWQKNLIWFAAGLLAGVLVVVVPDMPQFKKLDTTLSALQKNVSDLQSTLKNTQANLQSTTQERDTCNAKFDRATFLYDIGLFNNETRAWVIPADVEPVLAPGKMGNYSHYDPKTETETVHFKGKPAK